MEFTDGGIMLTGEEAQVFGHVVEMSGNTNTFPSQEDVDSRQLRKIIRPFDFDEPHDVEIPRESFPEVLLGANAVLARLDDAADELSRDPVGDRMPTSPAALRSLATAVEIRNAMASVLYQEEREQSLERHRQREARLQ